MKVDSMTGVITFYKIGELEIDKRELFTTFGGILRNMFYYCVYF